MDNCSNLRFDFIPVVPSVPLPLHYSPTLLFWSPQAFFASKLTEYKPLQLGSAEYFDNFNTTYTLGSVNSSHRRAYDTNTSLFWADLDGNLPLRNMSPAVNFLVEMHAWCRQQPNTHPAPFSGTSAVTGQFYSVAKSLLPSNASLLATAELFARLGAAQFDANVIGWYLKYYYLFWRPVSAIR